MKFLSQFSHHKFNLCIINSIFASQIQFSHHKSIPFCLLPKPAPFQAILAHTRTPRKVTQPITVYPHAVATPRDAIDEEEITDIGTGRKVVRQAQEKVEHEIFFNKNRFPVDKVEFSHCYFIGIDDLPDWSYENCSFFNCKVSREIKDEKYKNTIFPKFNGQIFNMYPESLYNGESLYRPHNISAEESIAKVDVETDPSMATKWSLAHAYDTHVYKSYKANAAHPDFAVTFAQSIHDHLMSHHAAKLLARFDKERVVAMMGGHATLRSADPDSPYYQVVMISKRLTELGYLMTSGGGPGAMEAVHVGAWFAYQDDSTVLEALEILAKYPRSMDQDAQNWLNSASTVMEKYPRYIDDHGRSPISLGIPTFRYGHEPATPFATYISKYFDNAIREDILLAVSKGGVIFTKGSAGTLQEVCFFILILMFAILICFLL